LFPPPAFDQKLPPPGTTSEPLRPEPLPSATACPASDGRRPFNLSSDSSFVYHGQSHDRAAQELLGAIWRREALVVLTGERGTGKTTLCRSIIEQLDRRTLTSFVAADPSPSIDDLLQTVLLDFGVISRDEAGRSRVAAASADLIAALRSFLVTLGPLQAFAVIIIDDAQHLSTNVLEQLRLLLEADPLHDGRHLLQVVLVGEPSLLSVMKRAELKAFAARISVRAALGRLGLEEVGDYIQRRLAAAGATVGVHVDAEAVARVHALTRGLPGVVGQLCDRAIALAGTGDALVRLEHIEEAAAQLTLTTAPRSSSSWVTIAALLLLLMLVGAAIAAWVFRDRVSALLDEWRDPLRTSRAAPSAAPPDHMDQPGHRADQARDRIVCPDECHPLPLACLVPCWLFPSGSPSTDTASTTRPPMRAQSQSRG
jgi:general secretion pathway protein A